MPPFNLNSLQRIITIIGPESTGKSALTRVLCEKLNAIPVWEYARTFLETHGDAYTATDLWKIAEGQYAQEQVAIKEHADRTIILDTNLEVIKVWSEHAFGFCPEAILQRIALFTTDLYLLMDIDMPWEYDPLREHGDPASRQYFFDIYKDIVVNAGFDFGIVSGINEQRNDHAMQIIQAHFNL